MANGSIVLLIGSLVVSACAAAVPGIDDAHRPAASADAARIIIKIRDGTRLHETSGALARTAETMGATLRYVRPLFGEVHLYELITTNRDTAAFMQAAAKHPNVEYIEPDRILRHQPHNQQ